MSSIPAIALNGLNAASSRINVSASNTVNQLSAGTPGSNDAYKPKDVVQISTGSGPAVSVRERDPATVTAYAPHHAKADDDGYVEFPNVDLAGEQVARIGAKSSYEANLKVLQTWDEMQESLLDIKS